MSRIEISQAEIEEFANDVQEIMQLLEEVKQQAVLIGGLNFYQYGKAEEAIAALQEVPLKYEAANEHYARLVQLLAFTWQHMDEMDQSLATHIGRN